MATELQRALENAMVEAQIQTTTAGVAAFLAERVADGTRKRKTIIAQGLKAVTADRQSSPGPAPEATPARAGSIPQIKTGSTIRPAAMEVAPAPAPSRRTWVVPTTAACAVLGLAGIAVLATSQSRASAGSQASNVRADVSSVAVAPAVQVAPPPAVPSASPGRADVPTVDVSKLPVAAVAPSVAPGPVAPAPRALASARPPAPRPARTRVDDGF